MVDDKHFYVGSANHDWRSLTQVYAIFQIPITVNLKVKELGIAVFDCPCLANDLKKIFDVYANMGKPESKLPDQWDSKFATAFNSKSPMHLTMNNEALSVYFTVGL